MFLTELDAARAEQKLAERQYEIARFKWQVNGSKVPERDWKETDRAWEVCKRECPLWVEYRKALDVLSAANGKVNALIIKQTAAA